MNNSRYLEAFELGRFDQMVRSGALRHIAQRRYQAVVASIDVRYLDALKYRDEYGERRPPRGLGGARRA
jgi:acyl-CoA thioesterase FadM